MPAKTLNTAASVCKHWSYLIHLTPTPIIVLLEITSNTRNASIEFGFSLKIDHFDDFPDHLICYCQVGRIPVYSSQQLIGAIYSKAQSKIKRNYCLNLNTALYHGFISDVMAPLLQGFECIIHREAHDANVPVLPLSCQSLKFENIQDELNLTGLETLSGLKDLNISSSGRFRNGGGYIRTSSLLPVAQLPRLKKLILNGPWFQDMIDSKLLLINFVLTLTQLESLILDFDAFKLTPSVIRNIFQKLPNLKHIGI